ncbi:MAG: OadG family protein [Clostridiales bacterium]|nr:OadG family protein [Clostridiales bacterium]
MKQKWKKITGLMLAAACTFALTACGKETEEGFQRITDTMVDEQCVQTASNLVDALASLDDAAMEQIILESRQDADRQIVEEWQTQTETMGALVEKGTPKKPEIDRDANQVTVEIPAKFENSDGTLTFVFDYEKDYDAMLPAYMTLTEEETFAGNMKGAVINTIMGVGTVFVVLIFLIIVISLFKYVGKIGAKEEKAAPAPKAAPVPKAEPVVEEDLTDDLELVAVISAAIAASENTSTDSFVVRSIKKVNRSKWQRA